MISLTPLPYAHDALAPHISAETIALHHGKHHKGYVDTVNKTVAETPLADASLETIVTSAWRTKNRPLFNAAAQTWNHGFYWHSLTPELTAPSEALAKAITRDFGSRDALCAVLAKEAERHFASGWAWLVARGNALSVVTTHDAATPLTGRARPLLVIDVWEHAYYLDHQNRRADYVRAVIDHALNWDFASENFASKSRWTYPA